MKFQVVYRNGTAEIHSAWCNEIDRADVEHEILVDEVNPYGAAVEAWRHEKQECPDELAIGSTTYFPCLEPKSTVYHPLPFDLEDDDEVILEAVKGKMIHWINAFSGSAEKAMVPKDGVFAPDDRSKPIAYNRHLNITESSAGHLSLNFVDYKGTGFRSVRLSAITKVGGR